MMIRSMDSADAEAVLTIYQEGLDTRLASFETQAPSWEEWHQRHLDHPRLIAAEERITGWAALTPVSVRDVYSGVAETSIYVGEKSRGKGTGAELLQAITEASESHGIWTLQASIFPENEASVGLHLSQGFRIVGTREKIARLDSVWRDSLLLERRSHEEHK